MKTVPFLSPPWLQRAQTKLRELLEERPGGELLRLSAIERLRNPPSGMASPSTKECVMRIEIRDRIATVSLNPHSGTSADLIIDCEWNDAHRAACLTGEALAHFNEWRLAQGRLSVVGSPGTAAPLLAAVHDFLAPITTPPGPSEKEIP